MRVVEADHLVVLDEVDAVGLEPLQGFIELPGRLLLRTPVDLGHQEHLVPIAVPEGLAHPDLALTFVVVPGVVHEVDPAIDRGVDDVDRRLLVNMLQGKVPAPEPDGGYPLARASQGPVGHLIFAHDCSLDETARSTITPGTHRLTSRRDGRMFARASDPRKIAIPAPIAASRPPGFSEPKD